MAGLVAASFLVAGTADAGAGATDEKKPDLIVESVSSERDFIVRNRPGEVIELRSTTENRGKRDAGASKTSYVLKSGAGIRVLRTFQGVTKLKGGDRDSGKKNGALTGGEVAIDRYRLTACADAKNDVAESNEKNNCTKGKLVSIVPWKLAGEVFGEYFNSVSGFTENWSGNNIVFEATPGQRQPSYFPTAGTLEYRVSGFDGFCGYEGGGQIGPLDPIEGLLDLRVDLTSYEANGLLGMDREYTYSQTGNEICEGPRTGPENRTWLMTGATETGFGNFGDFPDTLTGAVQFVTPDGLERLDYSWNLRVE